MDVLADVTARVEVDRTSRKVSENAREMRKSSEVKAFGGYSPKAVAV